MNLRHWSKYALKACCIFGFLYLLSLLIYYADTVAKSLSTSIIRTGQDNDSNNTIVPFRLSYIINNSNVPPRQPSTADEINVPPSKPYSKENSDGQSGLPYNTGDLHEYNKSSKNDSVVPTGLPYSKNDQQQDHILSRFSFQDRKSHINNICNSIDTSNATKNWHKFVVNSRKKVLYCEISKVASTTFTALLTDANLGYKPVIGDKMQIHSSQRHQQANITIVNSYNETFSNFTKFLVVRHPLNRVLSAYYNIVDRHGRLGPGLNRARYLSRTYNASIKNVTLNQFVHYLATSTPGTHGYGDRHWNQYFNACDPCNVPFDYVIYLEDVSYEAQPVLKALGWPEDYLINKINNRKQTEQVLDPGVLYLQDYKDVNVDLINKLLDKYSMDMKLFGYTFNITTLTTGLDLSLR